MITWLAETRPDLIRGLQNVTEEINFCQDAEDVCIITGKKMNVCTYCYTEHVFNWLVSLKVNAELIKEYFVYFNFDFHRLGYFRKAEKLGLTS